jgi:hypothetical protein
VPPKHGAAIVSAVPPLPPVSWMSDSVVTFVETSYPVTRGVSAEDRPTSAPEALGPTIAIVAPPVTRWSMWASSRADCSMWMRVSLFGWLSSS